MIQQARSEGSSPLRIPAMSLSVGMGSSSESRLSRYANNLSGPPTEDASLHGHLDQALWSIFLCRSRKMIDLSSCVVLQPPMHLVTQFPSGLSCELGFRPCPQWPDIHRGLRSLVSSRKRIKLFCTRPWKPSDGLLGNDELMVYAVVRATTSRLTAPAIKLRI